MVPAMVRRHISYWACTVAIFGVIFAVAAVAAAPVTGLRKVELKLLSSFISQTYAWLDHVIGKDPGIMTPLPSVYLKCTSMIMNTMNFSIDYSAPFIPTSLKDSYKALVTQQLLSPSHQLISKTGHQVSRSGYDLNNTINPQKLNTQSNVKMTLQYLGAGFCLTNEVIKPKDELNMFQQVCAGESICVFKGYLSPGDTFQIISRRHFGCPFSASVYINGLIAARISWCCEYRYRPGQQQGRRGCFRIIQLNGGKPCVRCLERQNSQNKHQTTPGRDRTCDGPVPSQEKALEKKTGTMQVTTYSTHSLCVAPPNTQPPARRRRRVKKKTAKQEASDSEQENKLHHRYQRLRKPRQRAVTDSKKVCSAPPLKQEEEDGGQSPAVDEWEILAETSVYSDAATPIHEGQEDPESPPSGKASPAVTQRTESAGLCAEECDTAESIHRKLAMALREGTRYSDVELSDSTDSSDNPSITGVLPIARDHLPAKCSSDMRPGSPLPVAEQQVAAESQKQEEEKMKGEDEEEEAGEDDLLCQITDLTAVLRECDEVEQLVLRNTGMTDFLLQHLAPAITGSRSELESLNLNLNDIGPGGAETLVHLVREKASIKSLLLHGNQLGDEGVQTLMRGLSELLRKDSDSSHDTSGCQLSELDIGGNQLASDGLRSVAAFLRLNPPLTHLGLDHSCGEACDAWQELFEAVKMNTNLTHLLLDENHLGDAGARLIADVIQVNQRLVSIDLDSNDIGEEGGRAIAQSLASNTGNALTDISLDDNSISTETREIIVKLLALK